jgi:hypothetical protein
MSALPRPQRGSGSRAVTRHQAQTLDPLSVPTDEVARRGIALPDGSGEVELPEEDDGYVAMIVCRDHDGSVRWQAFPPSSDGDAWVSASLSSGDSLTANSWSGWRVEFDLDTGIETARHTK